MLQIKRVQQEKRAAQDKEKRLAEQKKVRTSTSPPPPLLRIDRQLHARAMYGMPLTHASS
jgi:hypothetical protein